MVFTVEEQEIYDLTVNILKAIRDGDVEKYKQYSSDTLTAIEPESSGLIVDGLDFHIFFLSHTQPSDYHIELINPVIRIYHNTAYIAYALIDNTFTDGKFNLKNVCETRIFEKELGVWRMVHFHRS